MLSFVILVTVLLVNHARKPAKDSAESSGKAPPVAQIVPNPPAATSEPTPARPGSESPPAPSSLPAPAPELAAVPTGSAEPVHLAEVRNDAPAPGAPPSLAGDSRARNLEAGPRPAPAASGGDTPTSDLVETPRPLPAPVSMSADDGAGLPAAIAANDGPRPTPVDLPASTESPRSEAGAPAPTGLEQGANGLARGAEAAPGVSPVNTGVRSAETEANTTANATGGASTRPTDLTGPPTAVVTPEATRPSHAEPYAASSELPNLAPPPTAPAPAEVVLGPSSLVPAENPVQDSAGWVDLPTVGKGRMLDDTRHQTTSPRVESAPESAMPASSPGQSIRERILDEGGLVEAVPHVVQREENFWTISRLYYGSGRFYKALWAANRRAVPEITKLYVGQSIRIPPPEALDRSLIEPAKPVSSSASLETTGAVPSPTSGSAASTPMRRASRALEAAKDGSAPNATEEEVALPTSDPFAKRGEGSSMGDAPARQRYEVRRPRYKVRRYETLRSIARDTLGDSHRADEILELNEAVIDDPTHLITGQVLELPEDAKVGARRAR